ncbi:MAG TPA: LysR substrate-binding domain-containing protein [Candidatus Acidoferrales bacterium]|nr:LysR substrate-binding domain-containing protein [Candidatus Acidoferrales bacterium]
MLRNPKKNQRRVCLVHWPNMELRLLRYFIAVAEELNFTHAASRLHVAQPSLGQQIRQLEAYIGTPLFNRDKRRLQLTEAGRVFLREARRVLQDVEHGVDLARQAARAEAGMITVAMVPGPEGQLFSGILPHLLRSYPNLEITLRSLTSPQQITALQRSEINIGFLRGPIDDDAIETIVVAREPVVAVLPANHPLARLDKVSPADLSGLPLIQILREVAPAVHDTMHKVGTDCGVQFKTLLATEHMMTTLNAVANGLGFSLLAEYVEQIAPKNVVVRALDMPRVPHLELLAAYRKDDRLPALGYFLGMLRKKHSLRRRKSRKN